MSLPMEYARLAASLVMMCYGSYRDMRTREVSNKLWIVFGALGVVMNILDFGFLGRRTSDLIQVGISVGLTWPIALVFFYVGLYGGADAKALMILALLTPTATQGTYLHPFTPLTVLTNGVFCSLVVPLAFFLYNASKTLRGEKIFEGFESEPIWRKIAAAFLGRRIDNIGNRKFLLTLEKKEEGVRKFNFSLLTAEEDELKEARDMWVTPGIPLIVFLTAGFVIALVYGDLLSILLPGLSHRG